MDLCSIVDNPARTWARSLKVANRSVFESILARMGTDDTFAAQYVCNDEGAWVITGSLPDILCEQHERTVGNDNCVSFEGMSLQLPADEMRYHCARTRVRVHRYVDGTLAVFHGPRRLAAYDSHGKSTKTKEVLRSAA